jgi:hypothetical protein
VRILFILFAFLVTAVAFAQKYSPAVMVLTPTHQQYDSALRRDIELFNFEGYSTETDEKEFLDKLKDKPENIRTMEVAEWKFKDQRDFAAAITLSFYGMISNVLFGRTDRCLVLPSREQSEGRIDRLKTLAKRNDVRWILNPVSIHAFTKGGEKFLTIKLQLYDAKSRRNVLDVEYTGDTKNPGEEPSCREGSLECAINNVVRQALPIVIGVITMD